MSFRRGHQEPPLRLFAVAAPGTEDLVASELRALSGAAGLSELSQLSQLLVQPGGVEWTGDLASLYLANLQLRTASRVLLRVGELRALRFDELRRKAALLPWRRFAGAGGPQGVRLVVSATAHRCRLIHSGALAERVALAIADSGVAVESAAGAAYGSTYGSQRSIEKTDGSPAELDGEGEEGGVLRVLVRGEADRFQLSVDTSGALLHRRGYRLDAAPAPLRETLAAALLLRLGFTGDSPLCDPTCGSGTILIEAALLAMRRAPGRLRRFAFQDWPGFDERLWRRLLDEAAARERPSAGAGACRIFGADLDPRMVEAARENARRAGLDESHLRIAVADVSRSSLPMAAEGGAGLVLCNPPYGRRLDGPGLLQVYRGLGRFAASRPGWRLAILTTSPALAAKAGRIRATHRLRNGGLQVHLCEVQPRGPQARLVAEDLGEGLAHAADDELHRDGDEQEAHDALEQRAP